MPIVWGRDFDCMPNETMDDRHQHCLRVDAIDANAKKEVLEAKKKRHGMHL
jgi:hypothetical protein